MTKEFITLKLSQIHPYPNNPRINDDAVADVVASIQQTGNLDPIEIDEGNVILSGHTRYKALKRLKYKETECVRYVGLSEEEKRKYRLLANKTGEKALWDYDLLTQELEGLDFDGFDFGFDADEPDTEQPEAQEDDYDGTVPDEAKTKPGDIYQLGDHRLICGDSTDPAVIERLMDGQKADMVFTDPPYGVDYSSKNEYLNTISRGNCIQDPIENDALANAEAEKNELWIPAFRAMREFAKPECVYYITSPQGGELMMMMMALNEAGWKLKHTLIWNKNNHVLGRSDYNYKHEPILYGWNKKHQFYGNGKFKTSVWDIPKPQKSDLHPTMKPVELVANAMLDGTLKGMVVLDAFGGSGTTIIAAEQTGRKARLVELDPHYCDVIIDRWEQYTGQRAVLLSEG